MASWFCSLRMCCLLILGVLMLGLSAPRCSGQDDTQPDASATIAVSQPTAAALGATLQAVAQRRQSGDRAALTLTLPAGTYHLEEPLRLDRGLVGEGLTLRAQQSGQAILSGARELEPVDQPRGEAGVWRYALPEQAGQAVPRAVLVDAALRAAARHPNVGYLRIAEAAEDRRSGFRFHPEDLPADIDLEQAACDLVFLHDWSSSRLPVQSVDRENAMLRTVGPIGCEAAHYAIDHFEKQPRYWLEGQPAFADSAGEWYIDQASDELVLVAGSETSPPKVELPRLETLLTAAGDDLAPITNLRLEGLVFTGTLFPMPPGGLAAAQATMHEARTADGSRTSSGRPLLSAAVECQRAENAQVVDCLFRDLGNTGLWLGGRTVNCSVTASRFRSIGGNAINLGEDNGRRVDGKSWYQAAPDQVPRENRVSQCQIAECGRMLPGSVAIWAALHRRLEIAHNLIEDCPYTGISLGWIWNDSPSPAGENHVHHNRIRHVMQVLSDGGGVYTLGRQPDSRLDANEISNVSLNAGRAESNGMFLDEGTTGFTIAENRFRRIAKSPLRFHKAGKNHVTGNHWELETEATPAVRYNNTPEANISLVDNHVLEREPRIYLIGNSLTWDTQPGLLSHYVDWHVDCGKSLQFIHDHPDQPCVESSRLWPRALSQLQYDYLCLQPHYGTSLEQDVEVISHWMQMQPAAIVVIHTGWAHSATAAEEFAATSSDQMIHNEAYFQALMEQLKSRHPDREIRQTRATQTLHQIAVDIKAGKAPLENLTDLYRDAIHMTNQEGKYLMHNLMRAAVDQPTSDEGFAIEQQNPQLKTYLDQLLQSVQ